MICRVSSLFFGLSMDQILLHGGGGGDECKLSANFVLKSKWINDYSYMKSYTNSYRRSDQCEMLHSSLQKV